MRAILVRPMAVAKRARCYSTPPKRISKKVVKQAVDHATNLCFYFEDTIECRLAWETVEEIAHAYYDQETAIKQKNKEDVRDDPLENREYDV